MSTQGGIKHILNMATAARTKSFISGDRGVSEGGQGVGWRGWGTRLWHRVWCQQQTPERPGQTTAISTGFLGLGCCRLVPSTWAGRSNVLPCSPRRHQECKIRSHGPCSTSCGRKVEGDAQ